MDAVTICATNYLPFAEILGSSFLEFNPESTFSILVIDSKKTSFSTNKKFKYLTPDSLAIPLEEFENMAFYYNVTELATALKPSAIKALFSNGSKSVVYLDPDIQVFGRFDELERALENHSIVLTPHTINPIPRDGLRPSEADIMASGTFNLGFIALRNSKTSNEMLNWWEERLKFDSISDPVEMLFTDQRWIDFVPSYFPHFVLRHPSYNVAYWNLHERNLEKENSNIKVNGSDLVFFHFSGYRPETPWILSKYVADKPRVVISENPILAELCEGYSHLAKEFGWISENSTPYGYENFDSGKIIPSSLRRLYREDCIDAFKKGEIQIPPTDWQTWATSRSVESGNLSRILFSLWKSRPDLKRRFPDATGTEAKDLQIWAQKHGVSEKVIDAEFIQIGNLANDEYPIEFSKERGINVAGYLTGEFGLGESSRLIYKSAIKSGLPTTPLVSNRARTRNFEVIDLPRENKIFPFVISIINADHFQFWVDDIGRKNLEKSIVIGVWAWETEDFPSRMHPAFELVDEIWAVSNFVKNSIQNHTNKPVYVFPTPVLRPEKLERLDRAAIGIPENQEYNLFIFDYMSVFNRKNPLGAVQSHKIAFPNQDGPLLVLKSTNSDKDAINREKLRFEVKGREDIILIEDFLSRKQLNSLINECSSYISLHRSEGYGLTIAEAMALGKPTIVTNYSGNLDFTTNANSVLVPYRMVKIGKDSDPYDSESMWAEPDLEFAASAMVDLFNNKDKARRLGQQAQISILKNFTLESASKFILFRVNYYAKFSVRFSNKFKDRLFNLKKLKSFIQNVIRLFLRELKN